MASERVPAELSTCEIMFHQILFLSDWFTTVTRFNSDTWHWSRFAILMHTDVLKSIASKPVRAKVCTMKEADCVPV